MKKLLVLIFLLYSSVAGSEEWMIGWASKVEVQYNIPKNLLIRICTVESNWRNLYGANTEIGICQIKPASAKVYLGKEIKQRFPKQRIEDLLKNPKTNIEIAGMYVARLSRVLDTKDPMIIAVAYNTGEASKAVKYLKKIEQVHYRR